MSDFMVTTINSVRKETLIHLDISPSLYAKLRKIDVQPIPCDLNRLYCDENCCPKVSTPESNDAARFYLVWDDIKNPLSYAILDLLDIGWVSTPGGEVYDVKSHRDSFFGDNTTDWFMLVNWVYIFLPYVRKNLSSCFKSWQTHFAKIFHGCGFNLTIRASYFGEEV